LFDHCTIERNKLLIYDDDPHKDAAMKNARQRFEDYMKWKENQSKEEDRKIQDY
jgi:hypothetical protein